MSHIAIAQSSPPSPTSSLTCFDNRSDPMEFEPHTSPVKNSATSCRFSPYPKRPMLSPTQKHPHAILAQNRGPCSDPADRRQSTAAMQIFVRGIEALPDDILRSAVLEKYALAERSRHQLLLATWDLEGTKRKVHTLERIQHCLEMTNSLSESEYKFWLDMYTDRGLADLKEDELFYGSQIPPVAQEMDRDATELSVMVEHARERGLNVDSFDGEPEGPVDEEAVVFDDLEIELGQDAE